MNRLLLASRTRLHGMILVLSLVLGTASTWASEYFPLPEKLEDNVDFWVKIYTQYTTDDVVIHDSEYPRVVYTVVNMSDGFPEDAGFYAKWNETGKIMREYQSILRQLADMPKPIRVDDLGPQQRHVYILWAEFEIENKFSIAVSNIRRQRGLRDRFRLSIQRSGIYMDDIIRIFQSHDLPLELCYLPHVESSFNYKAYSKVGAAGLWQFTRYTGRIYMTISNAVDERLDPLVATDAAARLLKHNFNELGAWPLAITAYNHGANGMKRAQRLLGTNDMGEIVENYESRTFGFASKNFYASFLAACHVVEHSEDYYGDIEVWDSMRYSSVELPTYMTLREASEEFRVPEHILVQYNPAFLPAVVRNERSIPRGYELRLPFPEASRNNNVVNVRRRDSSVVKVSRYFRRLPESVYNFTTPGAREPMDMEIPSRTMRLDSLLLSPDDLNVGAYFDSRQKAIRAN